MRSILRMSLRASVMLVAAFGISVAARAQETGARAAVSSARGVEASVSKTYLPPGYVFGPEDQLSVLFWQDKDMSADVVVRPDGKISLPLLNEIQASGLTPEELRNAIISKAKPLVQNPNATVIVRQINSRKVFITGAVEKPGTYPVNGPTTVLQLIAMAAGVKDYANSREIVIFRKEAERQVTFKFDYKEVVAQKNLAQNIELKPGDTVVVP